jgi:hypothetical protein
MIFQSNDNENSTILLRTGLWTDNKVAIKRGTKPRLGWTSALNRYIHRDGTTQTLRTFHYLTTAKPTLRQMATSAGSQVKSNDNPDSMEVARFHINHGNL